LGDLYCSRLIAGSYSPPVKLAYPINVPTYDENGPFITPDGNLLLFSSDRPGGNGDSDLYASKKIDGGWSTPKNLGPKVNSDLREATPALSPDGKILYFTRLKIVNNKRQDSKIYQIDASVLELD
jgi:Tol biopolymer transport system component